MLELQENWLHKLATKLVFSGKRIAIQIKIKYNKPICFERD
ncbi:MAG: hypothetical protein RHS_4951 [Robinsoniella sp. RHS]|nr:MAG: hypothetical protein RHS_4951 [Robinsoniella sp. RHS]